MNEGPLNEKDSGPSQQPENAPASGWISLKKCHSFIKHPACAVSALIVYIAVMLGAFLYVAPLFINIEKFRPFFQNLISEKLKAETRFDRLDMTITGWGPAVELSNVVMEVDGKPVVSIKNLKARMSVISALSGHITFDEFTAEEPVARIWRKNDGTFNIPLLNVKPDEKVEISDIIKTAMSTFKSASITGGNIRWKDSLAATLPVRANVYSINASFSRGGVAKPGWINFSALMRNRGASPARLLLAGRVSNDPLKGLIEDLEGNDGPGFIGAVSLSNLDMERFWPYLRPFAPFDNFTGALSWSGSLATDFERGLVSKGRIGLSSIEAGFKGVPDFVARPQRATLAYDVAGWNNNLHIKKARADLDGLMAELTGKIEGLSLEDPSIIFSLNTGAINLENVKKYVPGTALTPQQVSFLKQSVKKGKLYLNDFTYSGSVEQLRSSAEQYSLKLFSGRLRVEGLSAQIPEMALPFDDMNGIFELEGDKLRLVNLAGRYGNSSVEEISGELTGLEGWPSFNVAVKADVNLPEAGKLLSSRMSSPEFKRSLEKVTFTGGAVRVDLNISGSTRDLVKTVAARGKITLDKVGLSHESLGLPIHGLSGEIAGDLKEIKLTGVKWLAGASSFALNGSLKDTLKKKPGFDMKLGGAISLEDMGSIKFLAYNRMLYQTGLGLLDMGVKGRFGDFKMDYKLDLTGAEYRLLDVIHKFKGTKNVYTFTGAIRNGEKVTIDRLNVDIGGSRIVVSGGIGEFLRGQGIDLTIETDGARLDDLDRFFLFFDDIQGAGGIKGKFSMQSAEGKPIKLAGYGVFEGAAFKLPVLDGVINQSHGEFELINNRIFLKNAGGRFNDAVFDVTGQGLFGDRPEFTLNIEADNLNLSDFFGKPLPDDAPEPPARQAALTEPTPTPDWIWNLYIKSKKGGIGILNYTGLNVRIKYDRDTFHVNPLTFDAHGGRWRWSGDIYLPKEPGITFDSRIDVEDLSFDRFLAESLGAGKDITGKLNLRGDISGKGSLWREMKRSLSGRLEARAGGGVIHRFNALAKIFSLLNVLQYFKLKFPDLAVDGMPYNSMSADFDVKGGVARTENLMVDSEAMRISAIGGYDIGANTVDAQIGIMPFVTVDRVLSSIPVAGYILTGENKGFLVTYFEAKGPLGDPEVNAIPIESLAGGIAGIFKRLFELPMDFLKALNGKKAE
ncbi:MAG: AsmA-like C-terminal domain-containing protein [Nitrospinae bacterium]|nr:AsmA-like C-terminal domain-containing protein [Nitrospinota bacterium]